MPRQVKIEVEFVQRYFYTRDGRRAVGQLTSTGLLISALAPPNLQAEAISLALRTRAAAMNRSDSVIDAGKEATWK